MFFCTILFTIDSLAQVDFCAVGDVLLDRGVREVIEQEGITYPFEGVSEIIGKNDLALFNLECPLSYDNDGFPINKRYSFRAEPEYAEGLKSTGFNIANIANNHTIDYGKRGFVKTIEVLKDHSIYPIGGGENQQKAFQPLLMEKDGETFAFFGNLEFLLEGTVFNKDQPYPAFGQIEKLCSEIQKINSSIDHIIVTFHWGQENSVIPTKGQISQAHKVIDAGADLVIGHHPHVLQTIETYKNKLILYSLGNFVFDNSQKLQKESVIFRCQFKNGELINPELVPVYINNCRPELASGQNTLEIFKHLNKVSEPFNTTLTLNDSIIKINYNVEHPIRELNAGGRNFYIYQKKIMTFNLLNEAIEFTLPDENYTIKDTDIFVSKKIAYLYSIVKNTVSDKSRIAVFPFSLDRNEFLKPSLDTHDHYNPWKLRVFDIDGDENPELIVGVNKSTRYYKNRENRIFVFNTDKDYFYAKWLGSKIGNPIVDFKICERTRRLVVLERSDESGKHIAVIYKWNNFGFDYDEVLYEMVDTPNVMRQFQLSDFTFITEF